MNARYEAVPASLLEKSVAARNLLMSGAIDQAERLYNEILASSPGETEATNFLSMRAIERGHFGRALTLLEQAVLIKPGDTVLQRGLGLAYMHSGRLGEAFAAFQKALQLDPDHYVARLLLGDVLNRMGNSHGALINYFGAITKAQLQGQWRDEATTPPWQREMVKHATNYVVRGRRALFHKAIEPMYARFGRDAMKRVEIALSTYLLDIAAEYPDSRQRPSFLFFPGLPTHPYFDSRLFTWIPELEAKTSLIRDELDTVLVSGEKLAPFHDVESNRVPEYLGGTVPGPAWETYFLFRHGCADVEHAKRCPDTIAALASIPLAKIRDHAPETLFSILRPGTEIRPHRGVTNTRLVVHLPLNIPPDCGLVVGGEKQVWQEGRALIFDDTFEHEAWNHSDRTRTVLIADIWNPYLTQAEQAALAQLIATIGDFNQDCGIN